ncbi:MAG TPA: sulfatase-like hydrolase/transferase [Pirellulales bacterium]|jgi:arylsulfatase A-like enzyme|nr:sulfatase-like hydrolase/transferase [Pirellulales bacterium]
MNFSPPHNIVVLVLDRLSCGFLGAYGNSWIQTPNFDRLAAEGFLFDRAVIDSPQTDRLYRSYWQGWHALAQHTHAARSQPALPRQLADAGYHTALLADEAWIIDHPAAGAFARRELILPPLDPDANRLAASVEETHLASFFSAAINELAAATAPFCLWLHTASLGQLWDAPPELRDQYRDEDDPPPSDVSDVPDRWLPTGFDPDELLATVHAYAGQISLLDLVVGELLDAIDRHPSAPDTLLAVVSARGFSLGEHDRVGPCDEPLYAELTHVPLIIRLPAGHGASDRTQALVQPADLHPTFLDWCGQAVGDSDSPVRGKSLLPIIDRRAESVRDRACTSGLREERAIVTPAWSMRLISHASEETGNTRATRRMDQMAASVDVAASLELFAKPDDWFEVNEVGDRCGEVASDMEQALHQFEQAAQAEASAELPPLPPALLSGIE